MPNEVCIDIKDELVNAGVGTFAATSGWGIYISKEPTKPDTVITLYTTPSIPSNPKWLLDETGVQARVRGTPMSYQATAIKAQAVKDALLGLPQKTINSTVYIGIWVTVDLMFLMYDDNNRPIFTITFRITREPSSGTNRTAL